MICEVTLHLDMRLTHFCLFVHLNAMCRMHLFYVRMPPSYMSGFLISKLPLISLVYKTLYKKMSHYHIKDTSLSYKRLDIFFPYKRLYKYHIQCCLITFDTALSEQFMIFKCENLPQFYMRLPHK